MSAFDKASFMTFLLRAIQDVYNKSGDDFEV